MKILVTGATGFIGSYVIKYLISQGHQVVASASSAKEHIANQPWFGQVEYFPWQIGNANLPDLFQYFNQPDYIIHLAWSNLDDFRSLLHFERNLPSHYAFLKNLVVNGLKNMTVCGTCFEYGMQEGCLSEDMHSQPANPYALAKYTLCTFLQELKKVHAFELKWLRLFYVYGEGQAEKSLIPQLKKAVHAGQKVFNMSKGDQVRDFLPVEEMAQKIGALALQKNMSGIINCCSGKPVRVLDFVINYIKKHNFQIEVNAGYFPYSSLEPFSFWGSTTKSDSALSEFN